jgi:hypothetical protein
VKDDALQLNAHSASGEGRRPAIEIVGYILQTPPEGGLPYQYFRPNRSFTEHSRSPQGTLQSVAPDFNRRASAFTPVPNSPLHQASSFAYYA